MSDLSGYEKELLKIERQRNRIEWLKVFATPLTILVTLFVAWLQINSANERNDLAASNQFEMALVGIVDKTDSPCLVAKMFDAFYKHNYQATLNKKFWEFQKGNPEDWQWYINVQNELNIECKKHNKLSELDAVTGAPS